MAKKIKKGNLITELVKGSLEYTQRWISEQFRRQFPYVDYGPNFYVIDSFADHVVVECYSSTELMPSEFYKVPFTKSGDVYTFAARDQWEIVELGYQPQTRASDVAVAESQRLAVSSQPGKKKGQRFEERIDAQLVLTEREEGKPRRIKIEKAITANVVNGNNRRYPSSVVEAAVTELRGHLNESAGQGRAIQILGEAEHPSDKGGRPNLLETVTKWDEVNFDGRQVDITGRILETSKGKDILTLMEGGVMPGVSLRGYGEGKHIGKGDDKVFEVSELHITGFDLVLEPSFENSAQLIESKNNSSMEDDMNLLEELKKLLAEQPELFNKGMTEAQLEALNDKQLKKLDESLRSALGIGADANIIEAVKSNAVKARQFDESQKQNEVNAAKAEAVKDLPFGAALNKMFAESIEENEFTTPDAVKKFAESQRKQFSKMAAEGILVGMGFDEKTKRVQVLGDVLEKETGTPSFARVAFELSESVRKHEKRAKRTLVLRAESPAAILTEMLLEKFDKMFQRQLMAEAKQFEEAETTSDLNLPYSVSRTVIAEAYPNLVAANVFDFGIMDQSPMNIFYETFTGETGFEVSITDEVETAGVEGTTYALAHPNIIPGTVVVTSNPAGTTYVEGVDFVIDYELGTITPISAGAIDANDMLVDYTYHATRQGENQEIERAKTTLAYQTITAAADRLADYITSEAIVFSASQIGWDAVGRTMANIIRELRRDKDRRLIEKALRAALSVASNSGGTWTAASDPWSLLAEYLGYAKVKVANRHYEPTSYLLSKTNSDYLSNWDGFTRAGFPNALLNAAGFAGGVKGLPIFDTEEMRDGWGLCVNREVVMHRVFRPMTVEGPFPTYSNGKLVAAKQYYAEEYNGSIAPIPGKASFVKFA
jgi:hypothetical protein